APHSRRSLVQLVDPHPASLGAPACAAPVPGGGTIVSRILIAEDEPRIVRFLVRGLQAEGHATASAADGELALQLARTGEFDLMLLDIGLPRMDGIGRLGEPRRRQVLRRGAAL